MYHLRVQYSNYLVLFEASVYFQTALRLLFLHIHCELKFYEGP